MRAQRASSPRAAREWRRRRHSCWAGCHNHAVPSKAVHGMSQLIGGSGPGLGMFFSTLAAFTSAAERKDWPVVSAVGAGDGPRTLVRAPSLPLGGALARGWDGCCHCSLPSLVAAASAAAAAAADAAATAAALARGWDGCCHCSLLLLLLLLATAARHRCLPQRLAAARSTGIARMAPARSASDRSACERGGARSGSGTREAFERTVRRPLPSSIQRPQMLIRRRNVRRHRPPRRHHRRRQRLRRCCSSQLHSRRVLQLMLCACAERKPASPAQPPPFAVASAP